MLAFWAHQEKMGLEFNPSRGGYVQIVLVADTDAEARRLYEPHVSYFFKFGQRTPHHFRATPGYRTRRSAEFAIKSGTMSAVANQASTARDWDSMVENGLIIAGSPDTVAERIATASRDLKIGNFLAILQVGNMPDELTRQNITMFGEKVIPKVRGICSDRGYE